MGVCGGKSVWGGGRNACESCEEEEGKEIIREKEREEERGILDLKAFFFFFFGAEMHVKATKKKKGKKS